MAVATLKENQPVTTSMSRHESNRAPGAAMLMSPPPEETLRHVHTPVVAKRAVTHASIGPLSESPATNRSPLQLNRKRARPPPEALSQSLLSTSGEMISPSDGVNQSVQYTPNPRVRKQKKREMDNVMSSPSRRSTKSHNHSGNPLADYLSPIASSSRISGRRSSTPIPPYDPPTERFTPPREIILSPTHTAKSPSARSQSQSHSQSVKPPSNLSSTQTKTKPRTRRTGAGPVEKPAHVSSKITRIKTEPPEVDLTAPPPPASPSDDPILLVGPPMEKSPVKRSGLGREDASILVDFEMETEIGGGRRGKEKDNRNEKDGMAQAKPSTRPDPFDFDFDADMDVGGNSFTFGDAFMSSAPIMNDVETGFDSDSDDDEPTHLSCRSNANGAAMLRTPAAKENATAPATSNAHSKGDGFSDSDSNAEDEDEDEEGDFTGKFRTLVVPLKGDTPSSAPKERSDRNGDWVEGRERRRYSNGSPHPRRWSGEGWRRSLVVESDEEDGEEVGDKERGEKASQDGRSMDDGEEAIQECAHIANGEEEKRKGRRLTLSELEAAKFGGVAEDMDANDRDVDEGHFEEQVEMPEDSSEPEMAVDDGDDLYAEEAVPSVLEANTSANSRADGDEEGYDHTIAHELGLDSEGSNIPIESFDQGYEDEHTESREPAERLEYETQDIVAHHEEPEENIEEVTESESEDERVDGGEQDLVIRTMIPVQDSGIQMMPSHDIHEDTQLFGTQEETEGGREGEDDAQTYTFLRANRSPSAEAAHDEVGVDEVADDDDDDDPVEEAVPDVVKIVSNDPKAAARAAAILKLHDYDMIARRARHERPRRTLEERLNNMRRRTVVSEGISKAYSPAVTFRRRRTFSGVEAGTDAEALELLEADMHNQTLPELLHEAEQELIRGGTPLRTPQSMRVRPASALSFMSTPSTSAMTEFKAPQLPPGPRPWVKGDWKWLDSCFTDVRLEMAELRGGDASSLPDVDEVSFEAVMGRFVELVGGWELVGTFGVDWTREKILQRIRALCKKQRSGRGAPPTPQAVARIRQGSVALTASPASTTCSSSMVVPDFTPTPVERLWKPGFGPSGTGLDQQKIPALTFGPGYAHLRDEVSADRANKGKGKVREVFADDQQDETELEGDDEEESQGLDNAAEDFGDLTGYYEGDEEERAFFDPPSPAQSTSSTVGRSLNYISSWFKPVTSRASTPQQQSRIPQRRQPQAPALPAPPASVLSKPRGPVNTPTKKSLPRSKHPKELVTLNPAPKQNLASRFLSKIARANPKRLAELQHVPTPAPKEKKPEEDLPEPLKVVRRRSSATSVKDMVKGFEELEKRKAEEARRRSAGDLKTVKSLERVRAGSSSGSQLAKPTWKP